MKSDLLLVTILIVIMAIHSESSRLMRKDGGRSIDVNVQRQKGVGTRVDVRGQANVWSSRNGKTKIDAQGQWSRVYRGPAAGKAQYGGGVSLAHRFGPENKPRGTLDMNVNRQRGLGTMVDVRAQGNVWTSRDGRTRVDAQGQWNRNFGGPFRGKPQYGGAINFSHRFKRNVENLANQNIL